MENNAGQEVNSGEEVDEVNKEDMVEDVLGEEGDDDKEAEKR